MTSLRGQISSRTAINCHSTVNANLTWTLFVHKSKVDPFTCTWLVPKRVYSKILSSEGKIVGIVNDTPVDLNGELALRTVHTSDCQILCHNKKGSPYKLYRATIISMYHRWSKQCSDSSSEDITTVQIGNVKKKDTYYRTVCYQTE